VAVACALLTATGPTDAAIERAAEDARRQIAFYVSTPAYSAVLKAHGWGELQPRLAEFVKARRWQDLAEIVSDEVLSTFALVGTPAQVSADLHERWGDILDRASLIAPSGVDEQSWRAIFTAHAAIGGPRASV
jgi:hypothetical protein